MTLTFHSPLSNISIQTEEFLSVFSSKYCLGPMMPSLKCSNGTGVYSIKNSFGGKFSLWSNNNSKLSEVIYSTV